MFNLTLSQTQAFASILAGREIDSLIAEETVNDLVSAHEEGRKTGSIPKAVESEVTPEAPEAEVTTEAPEASYEGMTDAELKASLCLRTSAFVSPNMTRQNIIDKLKMLDAEAVETAKPKAKSTAPKTQRLGVGKRQVELLKAGKTVDETLAIIQAEFPTAKTSKACVAWYKSKIKAGQF